MPRVGGSRYTTQVGWGDVPHLAEKTKREMLAATPPHLRGARVRGEPVLGVGRIYDLDVDSITVDPFRVPDAWTRCFALDTGWNRTACLWLAHDRDADCAYLVSEYYQGRKPVQLHALAIKARGAWVPGVIDPSSAGATVKDGESVMESYARCGLAMHPADNAVSAGIEECYDRMQTGRLRVFRTLQYFRFEFGIYRRDERGRVVKKHDHLMDCMRYGLRSGLRVARTRRSQERAAAGRGAPAVADRVAGF